jgi:cyanophycinase-like exopeptidase
MRAILVLFALLPLAAISQSYTSYFTGSATDVVTSPQGGICLMGGATEHDEAMKWFLQRANGGDILVLRASGSNGYNDYLYSQLGVSVNSVETIVFNNASASDDSYVQQKIEAAEAIWFAGGDQWDYVSYWRNTPVDSLINLGLEQRNIVIGGTSAGMAIQGGIYFSAENGTVTSSAALNNPYDFRVTADSTSFLKNTILSDVITDTHYDNPDRKGRHAVFLARINTDYGIVGKGIACDEYTAVCIDENGLASAYGEWPTYDENVYFIQPNCELQDFSPEDCSAGNPLEWNHNGDALKVYHIKATMNGENTFDLSDWTTGVGGTWKNWRVTNGILQEIVGDSLSCSSVGLAESEKGLFRVYPNPVSEFLNIDGLHALEGLKSAHLFDVSGKHIGEMDVQSNQAKFDMQNLSEGMYTLSIVSDQEVRNYLIVKH